jgi:hypothetical protein
MAQGFAAELVGVLDSTLNPAGKSDARVAGARVRTHRATLDLSLAAVAKVNGDTNVLARIPRGHRVIGGIINSTVTLGSSTVAIGISGTAAKYKAAAVFTATDTPTLFGKAGAQDDPPLTDYEDVLLTVGAADLPGTGIVVIDILTSGR